MKPRRPAGHDLQRLDGRAGCRERGERIGLGVEASALRRCRRPVTAGAGRPRQPASHAGGSDELVLRPVAPENLPDLEQRRHRGTPRSALLLRCGDQARKQARPHVGQVRRDRIGERELGLPPPNSSACGFDDERPGHRLDHAARRERALGLAGAHLQRGEHRLARRRRRGRTASTAPCRRRRCARPPRRCRPCPRRPAAMTAPRPSRRSPEPATKKPSWPSTRCISGSGTSRPARRLTSSTGKSIDPFSAPARSPATMISRRRAAAEVEHHLGRELEPRHHEVRIDAALEAIARVRIDAELAAGLRDVERLPQRRFDQHVGGRLVAARSLRRP